MRYTHCPKCGGHLSIEQTQDHNKPKCQSCEFVFYQNPAVGVAAILIKDKQLLMGKRIGSYNSKWCIPCGYVEYDEDVYDAIKREFLEETGLSIKIKSIYHVLSNFHNPKQHTVGIWFLAEAISGRLKADDDLDEVRYYNYLDIPELAFPTDRTVIDKLYKEGYIN